MVSAQHDTDATSQRPTESPAERADRNFSELLQELRVLFTGVQILLAFLLTVPFTAGFAQLDAFRHIVYVVALLSSATSSALLIAPVAVHRVLFQEGQKRGAVQLGHRLSMLALVGLLVTLAAGLLLVLDIAAGRVPAAVITGVFVAAAAGLWWGLPAWARSKE